MMIQYLTWNVWISKSRRRRWSVEERMRDVYRRVCYRFDISRNNLLCPVGVCWYEPCLWEVFFIISFLGKQTINLLISCCWCSLVKNKCLFIVYDDDEERRNFLTFLINKTTTKIFSDALFSCTASFFLPLIN